MFLSLEYFFRIFKKALIFTLIISAVISLFLYFTPHEKPKLSVSDVIRQNREEIYKLLGDKKLNSTKEGRQVTAFNKLVFCSITGEACTDNPADGDKNFKNSLAGTVTKLIMFPYENPPASGMYWAYSGLQNAGFIPKSFAAEGIGFAAIQPLSNLWKIFRDVAYLLLVLVLVTIGFMIMFRVKINPQTIISAENALPRIFISLILITFSFAIAGFLIDLMYIILAMSISILGRNTVINLNVAEYQERFFAGGEGTLWDQVFWNGDYWGVGQALFQIMPAFVSITIRILLGSLTWWFLLKTPIKNLVDGSAIFNIIQTGHSLGTIWQIVFAAILIPLIAILSPYILSLFVFFTAVFVYFRIFFLLFKAYVKVLLLIIFSPLMLLFEAIPGRKAFSSWLKNLVANLLPFPIVATLLIVSMIISATPAAVGSFWRPPFLYNISANSFGILVGVGILFLIPDVIKKLRDLMGIKDSGLSFGVGTFFGGITATGGAATGSIGKYGSLGFGLGGLARSPLGKLLPKETISKWFPQQEHRPGV